MGGESEGEVGGEVGESEGEVGVGGESEEERARGWEVGGVGSGRRGRWEEGGESEGEVGESKGEVGGGRRE